VIVDHVASPLSDCIETRRRRIVEDESRRSALHSAQAPTYLRIFLNATGRYADAREVLERRLKSSGHDDIASVTLAETLVLAGKPTDAMEATRALA
jgi:hypothetical protein